MRVRAPQPPALHVGRGTLSCCSARGLVRTPLIVAAAKRPTAAEKMGQRIRTGVIAVCRAVVCVEPGVAERVQDHHAGRPREYQRGGRSQQRPSRCMRYGDGVLTGEASNAPRQQVGAVESNRRSDRTLSTSSEFEEGGCQRQREPLRDLVIGGDLYLILEVGGDAAEDGEPEQR